MAHVFALVEARKLWMDIFIQDLTERRYPYEAMTGHTGFSQPNIREIKLLNISVPEDSLPYLYADLAPFTKSNPHMPSPLKNKALYMTKALRLLAGLKPISFDYEPSYALRRAWVNVMPIGWKEDLHDPKGTFPGLPKGGELL